MSRFSPSRAGAVLFSLCFMLVVLILRVAYLETYGRQQTLRKAERQQHQTLYLQARRGSIFDRNGFLLAGTIQTQTLFVDPKFMYEVYQQEGHSLVEMDQAIMDLSKILDRKPMDLARLLADRSTNRFVKVAENLDDSTCRTSPSSNCPASASSRPACATIRWDLSRPTSSAAR